MIKEYVPKIKKIQRVLNYIIIFELIFFTAFVGYEFLNWRRKMGMLTNLTKELSEKSELFTTLGNMDKEIEKIKEEMEKEKMVLFKRGDYEELITSFEKKLKELNLSLESIFVGEKEKISEGYFKVPIKMEIQGKMENILKFISFIENYKHNISIERELITLYGENFIYKLDLSITIPVYEEISVP